MTPLCFGIHIPYLIPVATGLLKEMYSLFSLICGTVLFFFLDGVKQNQAALERPRRLRRAPLRLWLP